MITVPMVDAIHGNAHNIPQTSDRIAKIAGYVTGTPDIRWVETDWLRFPHYTHIRIDQSATFKSLPSNYDVRDVEPGACPPKIAAQEAAIRFSKYKLKTVCYVDVTEEPNLAGDITTALAAQKIPDGNAFIWLANWNLDEAEAAELVGTRMLGFEIIGVQWASPSSNPDTLIPGGHATLREAQLDLSVVNQVWAPSMVAVPAPKPPVY
jgi:hypothetical protein